jgi:hypothetical protein
MTEEINIAVLGDLHGHIDLALSILKRWEKEHGKSLDSIIQVGDLGYFPDLERIDSATKRFAPGSSSHRQPSETAGSGSTGFRGYKR